MEVSVMHNSFSFTGSAFRKFLNIRIKIDVPVNVEGADGAMAMLVTGKCTKEFAIQCAVQ